MTLLDKKKEFLSTLWSRTRPQQFQFARTLAPRLDAAAVLVQLVDPLHAPADMAVAYAPLAAGNMAEDALPSYALGTLAPPRVHKVVDLEVDALSEGNVGRPCLCKFD